MIWRWLARKLCPYLIDEIVDRQILALTDQQRRQIQEEFDRRRWPFVPTEGPP